MIAASRQIRVFEAVEREPKCCDRVEYRADFAAWLPTNKVTEIANGSGRLFEPSPYVEEAKIAEPFVAYRVNGLVEDRYDAPELPEKVDRVNVRTGRRTPTPTVEVGCSGENLDFAVTPRGSVAWSFADLCYSGEGATAFPGGSVGQATIDVLPGTSNKTTVLAEGPTVSQGSLALVTGHLYWAEGGVARTYAVP